MSMHCIGALRKYGKIFRIGVVYDLMDNFYWYIQLNFIYNQFKS